MRCFAAPLLLLTLACGTSSTPCKNCGGSGGGGGGGQGGQSEMCTPGSVQTCYSGAPGTSGIGVCKSGTRQCRDDGLGYGECVGEVVPSPETCNLPSDEDCDGLENEDGAGCVCSPASTEPCYTGPDGTLGVGACAEGLRTCDSTGLAFGSCMGDTTPSPELCDNATDDDCDGVACGEPIWAGGLGSTGLDAVKALASDAQGNLFLALTFSAPLDVAGQTFTPTDAADLLIVKLGADGVPAWAQALATADAVGVVTVGGAAVGPAGELAISGAIPAGGSLDADGTLLGEALPSGFVVRLDGATGAVVGASTIQLVVLGQPMDTECGEVHWKSSVPWIGCSAYTGSLGFAFVRSDEPAPKTVGSYDSSVMADVDFAFLADGSTLLSGRYKGPLKRAGFTYCAGSQGFDWFVARLDPGGAPQWIQCFGTSGDDVGPARVAVGAGDEIYASGSYSAALQLGADALTADGEDVFLARLAAATGSFSWARRLGGPGSQNLGDLEVSPDAGPVVSGKLNAAFDEGLTLGGPDGLDGYVAELDGLGAVVLERLVSGPGDTDCSFTASGPDAGSFYATGGYSIALTLGVLPIPPIGLGDVWVARIGR